MDLDVPVVKAAPDDRPGWTRGRVWPCTERRSKGNCGNGGSRPIRDFYSRTSDSASGSWAQVEHRSGAQSATILGGAVQVAHRVLNQTTLGTCPVRRASEAVQHGLFSGRIDLKYRSPAGSAAP